VNIRLFGLVPRLQMFGPLETAMADSFFAALRRSWSQSLCCGAEIPPRNTRLPVTFSQHWFAIPSPEYIVV